MLMFKIEQLTDYVNESWKYYEKMNQDQKVDYFELTKLWFILDKIVKVPSNTSFYIFNFDNVNLNMIKIISIGMMNKK